jgi:hypothetical protein
MSFDLLAAPAVSVQTSFVLTADQRQRGHLCRGEPVNVLVRVTSVAPPPASLRLHSVTMLPANYTDEAVGTDEATAAEAAAEGGARLSEAGAVPLLTLAEGTAAEVDAGGCEMREGSIYSCLFRLEPTRDVRATSLGHVHVRWVRALSEGSARGAVPGTIERMAEALMPLRGRPMYLTVDLDWFDPAVLPGTGTPEPGGFHWREFALLVEELRHHRLVAADVVELAPQIDPTGVSAVLAAKVVRSLLLLLGRP